MLLHEGDGDGGDGGGEVVSGGGAKWINEANIFHRILPFIRVVHENMHFCQNALFMDLIMYSGL